MSCDVFAPTKLSSLPDTQQPKFGRREGEEKKLRAKKFPQEARSAGEWAPNWAENNCVISDTPYQGIRQGQVSMKLFVEHLEIISQKKLFSEGWLPKTFIKNFGTK